MTDFTRTYREHHRLLAKIAHRQCAILRARGVAVELDDLMQEAAIALLKAAERFDASQGVKFSTYLWRAVSNNLRRVAQKEYALAADASLDAELTEDGGTLHDVLPGDAVAPEDGIDRRNRARRGLERLSPQARRVVLVLDSPPPALAEEMRRQRAFQARCKAAGYAAPAVKLDVGFLCSALGYDRQTRSAVTAELRAVLREGL